MGDGIATGLPPMLERLFIPRPPLPYVKPLDKSLKARAGPRITGITAFAKELKNYDPDYVPWKTIEEKKKERVITRKQKLEEHLSKSVPEYNPDSDEKIQGDPFNTLFVGRLNYDTSEKDLLREFEYYGTVRNVRLVKTLEGKSRGYAFVEFEREKDLRRAYESTNGMKIDGRRILVDVERGRTVKGWTPRRLGGGKGEGRVGRPKSQPSSSGGGGGSSSGREYSSYNGGGQRDRGGYGRPSQRPQRDFGSYGSGSGGGSGGGGGGYRDRGGFGRQDRSGGYGGRRDDDRRRRSRSPRGYRDRERGRG